MLNQINIEYFKTKFGNLILGDFEGKLCLCDWQYRKMRKSIDKRIQKALNAEYKENSTKTIEKAKKQLEEYIEGERLKFDIPLLMLGTDFQKSVWEELLKIPFGETETYLGLSQKLENIKAIRAVASANGANAISIFVPCHRVIGSNGELTGYAGGIEAKKKLLLLEKKDKIKEQLALF